MPLEDLVELLLQLLVLEEPMAFGLLLVSMILREGFLLAHLEGVVAVDMLVVVGVIDLDDFS